MKIIIAGAYAIGTYLAELLSRNKYDITLIDDNPENLEKIGRDFDLLTIEASPTSVDTLRHAAADTSWPARWPSGWGQSAPWRA